MSRIASFLVASIAAMILAPISTMADIALSSNDGHTVLERGKQVAGKPPLPDSLSVIDLAQDRPRITATIEVPGSVVGPPMAVAVAPDESFAIVTSATKLDPAGVDGIGPDDRVSVIESVVRVIGPAFRGEDRAGKADDENEGCENSIPRVDRRDAGGGGGVNAAPHHHEFRTQNAEKGEDEKMV
jgi:hypothetical protein